MASFRFASLFSSVVLLSACIPAAHADGCTSPSNLITNCGFESGSTPANSNIPTGWSVAQWNGEEQIATSPVNSGSYSMRIANDEYQGGPLFNGAAILSQGFSDHAGDTLNFSFYLYNGAPAQGGEQFQAFFDSTAGSPVFSTDGSNVSNAFTQFSFNVTATGSDSITFTSYNNPSWFWLDDVRVVDTGASTVPTPTPGVTPEPGSLTLLGTGVLAMAGAARRRLF